MISRTQRYLLVSIIAGMACISTAVASATNTLSTNLITAVGSGDATKPGFTARVNQIDVPGANGLVGLTSRAEQQLAGIIATNSADLSAATNGVFVISGIINWNEDVGPGKSAIEVGNFTTVSDPSRPDETIPGIPGIGPNIAFNDDNFAVELITYIEFATPGLYTMGVNCDDGFKVTAADQAPTQNGALVVTGGSAAGSYYAVSGGTDVGGLSRPITASILGKLVYAQPTNACGGIINLSEIRGNIALIDRGGGCTFTDKILNAKVAGAIAAVIVNNLDPESAEGIYPIIMGGDPANLPAVMISKPDGAKIKSALASGTVNVRLTADTEPRLGEFNGEPTASDTIFSFNVPRAGVYPFRLVWFEDTGASSLEWFTVQNDGTKIPLNDPDNPAALKTFRSRTGAPIQASTLTVARNTDGTVTITWDHPGKLQETPELDTAGTTWTDVANGGSSPVTISVIDSAKFYRVIAQ